MIARPNSFVSSDLRSDMPWFFIYSCRTYLDNWVNVCRNVHEKYVVIFWQRFLKLAVKSICSIYLVVWILYCRAVARSENPGGLVVLGGNNVSPLVKIGLTDLPKTGGGALAPPVFGRSIHPISIRVGILSPPITTSPPGFSDLATALERTCFLAQQRYRRLTTSWKTVSILKISGSVDVKVRGLLFFKSQDT